MGLTAVKILYKKSKKRWEKNNALKFSKCDENITAVNVISKIHKESRNIIHT